MASVKIGDRTYEVDVRGNVVVVDGKEFPITMREEQAWVTVTAGGVAYRVQLPPEGSRQSGMEVLVDHRPFTLEWEGRLGGGAAREPRAAASVAAPRPGVTGGVAAQIAGRILSLRVKQGDVVKQGAVLLILEAMKMENEVKAPADGTVAELLVAEGDRVSEGQTLVVIG
jgi:glutaconyl-CoA/methylmalonyl-CoA decarboxylase subunit gamma